MLTNPVTEGIRAIIQEVSDAFSDAQVLAHIARYLSRNCKHQNKNCISYTTISGYISENSDGTYSATEVKNFKAEPPIPTQIS